MLGEVKMGIWWRVWRAVHGSVHGWCKAWCMDGWCGGGIIECVHYLGLVMLEHWWRSGWWWWGGGWCGVMWNGNNISTWGGVSTWGCVFILGGTLKWKSIIDRQTDRPTNRQTYRGGGGRGCLQQTILDAGTGNPARRCQLSIFEKWTPKLYKPPLLH